MADRLRYVPPGSLVEISVRVLMSFFHLPRTVEFRRMVVGTLEHAQRMYGVRLHFGVMLSSHYHLLATVDDAEQLARFMNVVNSKIAREACRHFGWSEKFWGGPYSSAIVSSEPEMQVARLLYLMAHGVKEGIVERMSDWTGLHGATSLVNGEPLEGEYFDRTAFHHARAAAKRARNRGEKVAPVRASDFKEQMTLTLEPLPCWIDRPEKAWRADVAAMVLKIENEAAEERERSGRKVVGMEAALEESPQQVPVRRKKSPAPIVHALSKAVRLQMLASYREFVRAFREAADRLRSGELGAARLFPQGSFPAGLPFVPVGA